MQNTILSEDILSHESHWENKTNVSLVNNLQQFFLPATCNPSSNFGVISPTYISPTIESKYIQFSKQLTPVHWTTIERWLSILHDKKIYAHHTLWEKKPHIYKDRQNNATDELDISLWLDKYVFLNIWRVNPGDLHDIYFCFDNGDVLQNIIRVKVEDHLLLFQH